MSRLPRLLRLMHTTNRQIPNPGQGGAPPTPSISPSTHEHHLPPRPQTDHLGPDPTHVLDPIGHEVSPSPSGSSSTLAALHAAKFTPKGKSIPTRPARAMSVQLPSGEPEPKTYPPGDEYFASLSERKQRQHPLWQFFHVPLEAKATLDTKASGPPQNMGSLELLGDDDDNIKSGELIRSPGSQKKQQTAVVKGSESPLTSCRSRLERGRAPAEEFRRPAHAVVRPPQGAQCHCHATGGTASSRSELSRGWRPYHQAGLQGVYDVPHAFTSPKSCRCYACLSSLWGQGRSDGIRSAASPWPVSNTYSTRGAWA
jgi:hypothetical protein